MTDALSGMFDVVVAGAGPGGSSAALVCARSGLQVLLVEKEALPRRKPCGGGLSPKALDALPVSVDPVVERRVTDVWITFGPRRALRHMLDRPGAMVRREAFDEYMAAEARRAGATLVDRCAVTGITREGEEILRVATEKGTIRARFLVGADGVHSLVRRELFPGSRARTVLAVEARVLPGAEVLAALGSSCILDLAAIPGGYGWIFPKADHLNVGLYRHRETPEGSDLRGALGRFIHGYPFLAGARVEAIAGAPIPIRPVSRSLVRGNVVLVGDAAGLGDALYGGGISFAVQSGVEAGRAIVRSLASGVPLDLYSRRVRGFRRDLMFSRLTAAAFYRLGPSGVERMARSPFVSRLFSGVVTGTVSPARCLGLTLAAAPAWLLSRRDEVGSLELSEPRSR